MRLKKRLEAVEKKLSGSEVEELTVVFNIPSADGSDREEITFTSKKTIIKTYKEGSDIPISITEHDLKRR